MISTIPIIVAVFTLSSVPETQEAPVAKWAPLLDFHLRLRSPHQPANERNQEQNDEDKEQNLGDPRGCSSNSEKAKYRCDDRDDQEYYCPSQHGASFRGLFVSPL
jgi:hypothetical protein